MIPLYDENPTRLRPFVTIALIALNIVAYVWEVRGGDDGMERIVFRYGTVPYNLTQDGEVVRRRIREYGVDREGQIHLLSRQYVYTSVSAGQDLMPLDERQPFPWATLLTGMFLHGGFWHLLGNLWFLWIFGNNCEDAMGAGRFLVFYLLTGLAASGIHVASDPESFIPTIGASGAISGVLGAYIVLYPRARVFSLVTLGYFFTFIRIPAFVFLGFWLLMQVTNVFGGGGGGVAWYAHIGGFVAGLILVKLFESGEHRLRGDTGRREPPGFARRRVRM